jgi:Tol biopolymer transport system component
MKRIASAASMACALLYFPIANATDFDLVSLRGDGTPPSVYSDGSEQPAITPDGRYVVFVGSSPDLVTPGATGLQVYLRDRLLNTTEIVSVSNAGVSGNSSSSLPSISDDGCRVVFNSYSSNLVAGDANGLPDVFLRNRCTSPATTTLVSQTAGGVAGNAASSEGRISGNGSRVVFVSNATNLAAVTGAGNSCLYRRDLNAGTTTAIATASGNCIAAGVPDISADATRVVFWAYLQPGTSNLVNGVWQIYLYDFAAGGTQPVIVSTDINGTPQSQGSEGASTVSAPAISADGGYIAFAARSAGLVATPGGADYQVYAKELSSGFVARVSVDAGGNPGNAGSSGSGQGYRPGLSRFAKTVTFLTSATNLAAETGGFYPNVVAHNPYTGRTIGFTSDKTLNGTPAITAGGELIVANSLYALDTAYASRGMFVFPGMVSRLGNISTRGKVLTGSDVMIGGFIVQGTDPQTVVIVATGPSLAAYGIANPLANPTMTLVRSSDQSVIAINDDWGSASNAPDIIAAGFAPAHPLESAIMITLEPGAYTAIVSGVGGGTGVGLIAAYKIQ